jgi:hypothetical protein
MEQLHNKKQFGWNSFKSLITIPIMQIMALALE